MTATSTPQTLERLNDLLVEISRSLLQYANEAYPWSEGDAQAGLQELLVQLGEEQRDSVRALVAYLDASGHRIDFGVYPDEYTSLHYVSAQYFLGRLIEAETALVAECQSAARELASDADASSLVHIIAEREQSILSDLKSA
jgi:hypothetical protein